MVIHSSLKIGGKLHGIFGKTDEKSLSSKGESLKQQHPRQINYLTGDKLKSSQYCLSLPVWD
jgi:hypothetical protein